MALTGIATVRDLTAEDILDSRDLIELRDEITAWLEDPERNPDTWDEDDAHAIVAAVDELENLGTPDWQYGETFIRDTYFTDYARDLAEDIGAIDPKASWPLTCIDWEQAARELRMDYSAAEIDGTTYWARS